MNSKSWMVISASLLAVLWIWGGTPSRSDAQPAQPVPNNGKAVIIQCTQMSTGPDPALGGPYILTVFLSSSSAGAPIVNGGECAQAIASVLAAGFQLNNVAMSPNYGGPIYTLIK